MHQVWFIIKVTTTKEDVLCVVLHQSRNYKRRCTKCGSSSKSQLQKKMSHVWFAIKDTIVEEDTLSVVCYQSRNCKIKCTKCSLSPKSQVQKKMHEVIKSLFSIESSRSPFELSFTKMQIFYSNKSLVIRNLLHQDRDVLVGLHRAIKKEDKFDSKLQKSIPANSEGGGEEPPSMFVRRRQ
ncbi:hypothetical protein H5410_001543 [Solanum commersonii]|uniref:Uncharacterized protein n=1 Tax=Solanum commersonii TaxID=4109 RepID=A0A9J6AZW8_SOLCO|nr:hypothetical protein H5410_001543 [Solanum commersonii]